MRNVSLPLQATIATLWGVALASPGFAQSITATPDGTGTQITPQGNAFLIEGGTQTGTNLFHSFDRFGLSAQQQAIFQGTPDLANILGRVTGGQASFIDGLLQTQNTNANLYLMNPAGLVLGPNASLDLGGSFTATTATAIGFENGWFNASGSANYDLLVGSPNRFAFTESLGGAIVNEGNLAVDPGQSLTLLGGTVVNTGNLSAPGGVIQVRAVPGETMVRLEQAGMVLALDLEPLPQDGDLVATGINPLDLPALLTGGDLTHATALVVRPDGSVSLTSGEPGLILGAGDVALAGSATVDQETLGDGGQIQVMGENHLEFLGSVSARGGDLGGDGGLIDLSGKETLNLVGDWFNRVDLAAPQGIAGTLLFDPNDITIQSGSLAAVGGSPANANTLGAADISSFLNSTGSLVIATTGTGGSGDITLDSGAAISWTSANGLTLNADRAITLNSGSSITSTSGAITLNANTAGTAGGGLPGINVDGGSISSSSGAIAITAQAGGGANGGREGGVQVVNGGQISSTTGGITLTGTGSNGGGTDPGLYLDGAGTLVQTQDGDLMLIGFGGGGVNFVKDGIYLSNGATLRSTGLGNISLAGTPGYPSVFQEGSGIVMVSGSTIESLASGSITLNTARDIYVDGSTFTLDGGSLIFNATQPILSTLPTTIQFYNSTATITGSGSIQFDTLRDINIQNSSLRTSNGALTLNANQQPIATVGNFTGIYLGNASLTSDTGAITLRGRTGDSGSSVGVQINASTVVKSTATGTITVQGDGVATNTSDVFGVWFGYDGAVETTDGALTIIGNVSGANSSADAIRMVQGGQVRSTGTGTIDIAGSITGAGSGGRGIVLAHGGTGITTKDGTISITGTSINSLDVHISDGALVRSTGLGNINLTSLNPNSVVGVQLDGGAAIQATGTGTITVTTPATFNGGVGTLVAANGGLVEIAANGVVLDGTLQGGTLLLRPFDDSGAMNLGATVANSLSVTATQWANFAPNFSQITVGLAAGTGTVTPD